MNIMKSTLLTTLLLSSLYADNIDTLLSNIEQKTDLSQKTKLANSGVSFVWTRDDLERMQITNLKQILKTAYPFGYDENRYGLVDPFNYNSNQPFVSQPMRLYIDNQEITSGLYGSGVFLMGDANIDWVDHVEIYTQAPTYEYATESTVVLIKLYSKSVLKDEGSNVKIAGGSYGAKSINAYNAGWINDDWSYFAYGLHDDAKREKHDSFGTQLSRDKIVNAAVATLHNRNINILLNAFSQDRDGFANASADATPTESKLKAKYLHIGVDGKVQNFGYLFSYSYANTKSNMSDDVTPTPLGFPIASAISDTHDYVFTGELKYTLRQENNKLLMGTKYRTKRAKWDRSTLNGIDMTVGRDSSVQNIITLYTEDQYSFASNSVLTAGVEYQRVTNSDSVQNDNLFLYRFSHTYTTNNWTLKTLYSHLEVPLAPYLIKSNTFLSEPLHYHNLETIDTILENIIYKSGSDTYELIVDYSQGKDYYLPLDNGKIVNYKKKLKMPGVDLRWIRIYNNNDKFFIRGSVREIQNAPYAFKIFREYGCVVRNINSYKKYDIFNELVYDRNNISKKNSYNYSLGVRYHYNKDTVIALKGLNIFDDARETPYYRINPNTFVQEEPLKVSPIDREIMLSIDWAFE
ncbi:hypothetical protein MNB_SM-6-1229 [hydrothermal vent metagenome]|uniref:TonB-dependent receptor n=1 Tax=hydrothermal vent metagenome TaxID=652676 RepID=A0A1W1CQA3_9ZZZZ